MTWVFLSLYPCLPLGIDWSRAQAVNLRASARIHLCTRWRSYENKRRGPPAWTRRQKWRPEMMKRATDIQTDGRACFASPRFPYQSVAYHCSCGKGVRLRMHTRVMYWCVMCLRVSPRHALCFSAAHCFHSVSSLLLNSCVLGVLVLFCL